MTKIDIISGFLGAGKTTLIKKLLDEALQNEKVVVIENEFGQIGIDGKFLKGHHVAVKEINSGCICCTLQGDFSNAIKEILKKHQPERIIIEPSGIGKLSDIIRLCLQPQFQHFMALNMLIVVVDAVKFELFLKNFGEFFKDQLEQARTIILSRSQDLSADRLESVSRQLQAINPAANVMTTRWEQASAKSMISLAEGNHTVRRELEQTQAECKNHAHGCTHQREDHDCHCQRHSADEVFTAWGAETSRGYTVREISEILSQLSDEKYGLVVRSKGILPSRDKEWIQFDYVSGEIKIKPAAPDYTGRICVIGEKLDRKKVSELFKVHQP